MADQEERLLLGLDCCICLHNRRQKVRWAADKDTEQGWSCGRGCWSPLWSPGSSQSVTQWSTIHENLGPNLSPGMANNVAPPWWRNVKFFWKQLVFPGFETDCVGTSHCHCFHQRATAALQHCKTLPAAEVQTHFQNITNITKRQIICSVDLNPTLISIISPNIRNIRNLRGSSLGARQNDTHFVHGICNIYRYSGESNKEVTREDGILWEISALGISSVLFNE